MQALASEAALALERTRSAAALAQALERERLVAEISRKVRSELDLDALMRVAVDGDRARARRRALLHPARHARRALPIAAEWHAPRARAGRARARRPAAASRTSPPRERRTVAVGDVEHDAAVDATLGGARTLLEPRHARRARDADRRLRPADRRASRSTAPTARTVDPGGGRARRGGRARARARDPHRPAAAARTSARLAAAGRAPAGRAGRDERAAAATPCSQRLVDAGRASCSRADAADCYLLDAERRRAPLRRRPRALAGARSASSSRPAAGSPAGRCRAARPVRSRRLRRASATRSRIAAYASFESAIVAPMTWGGEVRGVVGVGTPRPARDVRRRATPTCSRRSPSLASLALRNAESFEQSARQARIQRGFYRIASVLAEPLSLAADVRRASRRRRREALGGGCGRGARADARAARARGGARAPRRARGRVPSRPARRRAARCGRAAERARADLAAARSRATSASTTAWRRRRSRAGYRALLAIPVEAPRRDEARPRRRASSARSARFTDDDLELARHLARRGARRARAERALRGGAHVARARAAARAHRQPARDRARPGGRPRRGRRAGAGAARRRRVLDPARRGRRARRQRGHRRGRRARARRARAVHGLARRRRRPVARAGRGRRRGGRAPRSRGRPAARAGYVAYLGVPLVGPEGGSTASSPSTRGGRASGARRRSRRSRALAANASAALSNAELYQRVALERERSVAILANIADGIVAVDRDGHVVLWNAAAERITASRPRRRSAARPSRCCSASCARRATRRSATGCFPIRRGDEEVWLSLTEAVMRDPAGAGRGPHLRLPRHLRRADRRPDEVRLRLRRSRTSCARR